MGRCRPKADGGAEVATASRPPHLWGGGGRRPTEGRGSYLLLAAAFFGILAGILRAVSSAFLTRARAEADFLHSPGTITYPPILCPAIGSKSRPPEAFTFAISASGSRTVSSSPHKPQNMFPFT